MKGFQRIEITEFHVFLDSFPVEFERPAERFTAADHFQKHFISIFNLSRLSDAINIGDNQMRISSLNQRIERHIVIKPTIQKAFSIHVLRFINRKIR